MVFQDGPHDRSLGPCPPAVNQANLRETAPDALLEVVADDVGNVPRREGVKVEAVPDREDQRGLFRLRGVRKIPLPFWIGRAWRHRSSEGQLANGGRRPRKGLAAS